MPHCWKSHVAAHMQGTYWVEYGIGVLWKLGTRLVCGDKKVNGDGGSWLKKLQVECQSASW